MRKGDTVVYRKHRTPRTIFMGHLYFLGVIGHDESKNCNAVIIRSCLGLELGLWISRDLGVSHQLGVVIFEISVPENLIVSTSVDLTKAFVDMAYPYPREQGNCNHHFHSKHVLIL